ncbi:MAG: (Fe-S)-binding protein [Candidatus Aminicenantes bacterium]|nr:MAG: (Fe-S)-binding protein [Candidatus Aminicenantes bacterium]
MSEKALTNDPLEEKIKQLKPEVLKKALQVFRGKLNQEYAAYLNSCVHCGLCADSCHYYLTHKDVQSLPAYKLNLVNGIYKKYFSFIGKNIPGWVGGKEFNQAMVREWVDSLFGRCTLCGRCSLNCSLGLNIHYLIRTARSALAAIDIVPPGLQSTVDTALEKGNNMGIAKEDWIETVEWLEEELQEEARDKQAVLPRDKKGARLFYTVNPREPMFFPLSILAVGKIFYAAGESWTFSSDNYDVTNYGYYSGDDEAAAIMSDRLVQSMKKLDCKTLVLAECGHGLNANRWEAAEWLSKKYDFEVKSILEIVADYIRQGRIKLDPSLNPNPVTLHDPCNLVRLGGIVEEQRFILKNAVSHFIEMFPNKEKNFCCGGGGGQLAMTRFSQRRLKAGQIKADQIRKTGAKIVATPCHNCIDQLTELNKHYKLGVEAKTICEITADALLINRNKDQFKNI